jgi:hypothetical protein
MPYDEVDPQDPLELVAVALPADGESPREMAYVFAEEFARMGYDAARIVSLFRSPFYTGANGAYRALGDETTRAIIDECLAVWGRVRLVDH